MSNGTDTSVAGSDPEVRRLPRGAAALLALVAVPIGVLLLVGCYSLLATALDSRAASSPLSGGVSTTGQVAAVEIGSCRLCSRDYYIAVVRFEDSRGLSHLVRTKAGGDRPAVGSPVDVSYDPARPERAHDLTTNRSIWTYQASAGVACGAAGVVFCAVGFVSGRGWWQGRALRVVPSR